MAANGDNNDAEGPFDPWTAPYDVMHLLHIPGGLYPPPATAPMESVTTGSYGCNNPFDWTMPMPGNGRGYSFVESSAPPVAMAGPSTSAHRQDVHASSSSYVNQGVLLDCTGCQLLREIQHSNGFETTKLCIHGAAAGLFYHATLEVYHVNPEGTALEPTHRSFVDFVGLDHASVKQYLMDYAQARPSSACTVVYDSTAEFLDVLCTRMAAGGPHEEVAAPGEAKEIVSVVHDQVLANNNAGGAVQVQPMVEEDEDAPAASGPSQPRNNNAVEEQEQQNVQPCGRSRLAIQRERTSKLERHDISRYFHLPMVEACKKLGVCGTVLKGVRKKFGITRWPYRTINKIDNQIAKLRENGNLSAAVMDEIRKLSDYRREIIDGPSKDT